MNSNNVNKDNKIQILNHTLLKAATLMVRRDFLTKVLNDSDNTVNMKMQSPVSKHNVKKKDRKFDTSEDELPKIDTSNLSELSDSDSVMQNINISKKESKRKEKILVSDDNSESNTQEESSSKKQNIMKIGNPYQGINVETEIKKKKREIISDTSDSEQDHQNSNFSNQTNLKKRKFANNGLSIINSNEERSIDKQKRTCKSKLTDNSNSNDIEAENIHHRKGEQINTQRNKYVLGESDKSLETYVTSTDFKKIHHDEKNLLNVLGNMDEEIYLVQMPKNLDPRLLLDKSVSFDQSTKLKYKHNAYIWNINYEKRNAVNFVNFDTFHHFNPEGVITVCQYFKTKNPSTNLGSIKNIPSIPDNLKRRHPLFGTKYKHKIKLKENSLKMLNDSYEDYKYRYKLKDEQEERECENEGRSKKKKFAQSFPGVNKPQKKIKHCNKTVQDFDKCIKHEDESSSYNNNKHQLHKTKHEIINSTMSTSDVNNTILQLNESVIPKIKKKHRHLTDTMALDNFINDLVKDVTAGDEASSPKKKQYKQSH